jgi:hypothetical protein
MNNNKMDEEKGPKNNKKSGLVIGGLPPKRCNRPHSFFGRTSNPIRGVERRRCEEVEDFYARRI